MIERNICPAVSSEEKRSITVESLSALIQCHTITDR